MQRRKGMGIVEQVRTYCLEKGLIAEGDRVLLAVSGGADSIALLSVFCALQKELQIEIAVVHLEHGLRGMESVKDQKFVKKMADAHGVPYHTKSINVLEHQRHYESVEQAARRERHSYFFETLRKAGYSKIATGHTMDDNVETIIFRLISGTGPAGIRGILPKAGSIIHPMLPITRDKILKYLSDQKLEYRQDETNFDRVIARNKIRHEVIPIFKSINLRYREHILSFAAIINEENELVHNIAMDVLRVVLLDKREDAVEINYARFMDFPLPLKRRIILWAVRSLSEKGDSDEYERRYISYKVVDGISQLEVVGNKTFYKDEFVVIEKEYNVLRLKKRVVNNYDKMYLYYIEEITNPVYIREIGRKVVFRVCDRVERLEKHKLYFDYNKLTFPLVIRGRKIGDRIKLVNLGNKKLKTIFINEKIPGAVRSIVPIIESGGVICGIFLSFCEKKNRCAEGFMINGSTKRILECELV